MRNFHRGALLAAACGLVGCLALSAPAQSQTAEEIVQKQLGQLMIANANCSAQTLQLTEELRKVKAELEALKAKQPDAKP